MQALPIIEHLNVFEYGRFRLLARAEAAIMNMLDLVYAAEGIAM